MVTLSLWSRRCEWASSRTEPSMWSLTPLRSTGQSHSRGRGLEGFWLFFKSWIFRFANLECDKWPQWGSKQCWRLPSSPRWFRRRFLRTPWRSSRCTARISGRFAPSSHHIERHIHMWMLDTMIEWLPPCRKLLKDCYLVQNVQHLMVFHPVPQSRVEDGLKQLKNVETFWFLKLQNKH